MAKDAQPKKSTGVLLPVPLHAWAKTQAIKDSVELGRHVGFNDLVVEGLQRVQEARKRGKGHEDL